MFQHYLKPGSSQNVSDEEIYIKDHTLYRIDRVSDQRGGSVALYIKSSIPHEYSDKLTKDPNMSDNKTSKVCSI